MTSNSLIAKYNVPGPRYTSYPTVPYWDEGRFTPSAWERVLREAFVQSESTEGVSIYTHLPYCETPCTFCGCTKQFTRDHGLETGYIDLVHREWAMLLEALGERPLVKELHFGGGTPTFFSARNLARLTEGLLHGANMAESRDYGFEANPNSTTKAHLQVLHEMGFERVSFGVQDFDPTVQATINRVQPYERVAKVTELARGLGYRSVNFDLIYGLPKQRLAGIERTMAQVIELRPDRIAYYGYAHVPWIKGIAQRRFSEEDIPRDQEKRALYELGRSLLIDAGYEEVGMDHFVLPNDSLYVALQNGTVHRNFMGYTPFHTQVSMGLGMSAISDAWHAFAQNEKSVRAYAARIDAGEIPVFRGHMLSPDDLLVRQRILDLMCRFETYVGDIEDVDFISAALERLSEMRNDGLVVLDAGTLRITAAGRPFVRNVCMAFDARLWAGQPVTQLFSDVI